MAGGIGERFKSWQSRESAKRKAIRDRLAHLEPFREQILKQLTVAAVIFFPIGAFLSLRVRMDFKWITGGLILPGISLIVTLWCLYLTKLRCRLELAKGMLLIAIVFSAAWPQASLLHQGQQGYPQYGGIIMLTILLSGLLIGEFYVGAWTLICCVSFQYAINNESGWTEILGWSAIYVACAWVVIQFSKNLEQLHEASRLAEEKQRSAIVAERTRFARDIHDTLAQGFTGILMQLSAAEQRLHTDAEQVRIHIERARQLANESLEEARRSVSALRVGAAGTLLDAIAQIGNRLISDSGIRLETRVEGQPYSLPETCESNLMRIAQEALTNAVRHAHASSIYVFLAYRTGSVLLEIGDTGHGMSGGEPSGFGVDGMRQRARQIGGEIKILSDPGSGTRIMVTVPNA
jgi:signal transduction histidine kinase